ncbi:hypothetical protein FA95DRAFT_1603840 [Auriscalpium vulgare]|uniref:Uncharacterized protein n=1 Tax=Auriscalpium vulgare TaxID=40419 RepID=A0ACB8S2S6_9AGAM|nr:hypothetical protein FA95DRAFT_1603840 [Auriscalpium vulgare]
MQGAEEVTARVAEEEAARHAEAARRAQEAIRHAHEEAALRAREAEEEAARVTREAEQVAARQAREAQREAVCRAREAEQQARQAAIIQKEAETTQTVISGSIVTFAAGLDIRTIVTGFESCTIRIEKLPANTQHDDVSALLTSYGVDSGRFHVVGVKMGSDGKTEAEIIADADCGRDLASWLDDDAYQLWRGRLKVEVSHNGTGGMGQPGESSGRDVEVLTISWHATSVAYIAEYEDIPQANRKVRDLDCRRCCGCIVEVQMNDGADGHHFVPQSIKIMNLPAIATDEDVARFAGTPNVRRLLGSDYSLRVGHDGFCVMLRDIVPKFEIEEFDGTPSKRGIISLHVRFMSSEDADKAHKALTGKRYFFLNNSYLSVKFRDRTI